MSTGSTSTQIRPLVLRRCAILLRSLPRLARFDCWLAVVFMAWSSGYMLGAIGIAAARALGHRHWSFDKVLAQSVRAFIGQCHYHAAHTRDHVRIGLPDDPASPTRGQNLWTFLLRDIVSIWRDAKVATNWLRGLHRRRPEVLFGVSMTFGVLALALGAKAFVFWLVQGTIGFFLIAGVDCIQHERLRHVHRAGLRYASAHGRGFRRPARLLSPFAVIDAVVVHNAVVWILGKEACHEFSDDAVLFGSC